MKARVLLGCTVLALSAGAIGALSTHAAPEVQPTTSTANATAYTVDGVHSSVVFCIKHLGVAPFYGRFNETTGSFTFDAAEPEAATVNVEIKTDSVDSNADRRDNHLKSPDFFNVREFPAITFKSTGVTKTGDKTMDIAGDLTMHGVTKSITASATFGGEGEKGRFGYRAGFDIQFTVNRTDFGMDTYSDTGMLGDEVKIMIGLEGQRDE